MYETRRIKLIDLLFDLFNRTVRTNLHFPMDIHSIHPLRQPEYVNRCGSNRGGCSHLCLPNRSSYTCACPPGLQLITPNGRTCTNQPGELLIFAQKSELRLFPLNVSGEVDHVLPLTGVRSAVALDWDGASKSLYSKSTAIFYRKLNSILTICFVLKSFYFYLFFVFCFFFFFCLLTELLFSSFVSHSSLICLCQVKPFFGPTSSRMSSTEPSGTVPTNRRLSPTIWNRLLVLLLFYIYASVLEGFVSSPLSHVSSLSAFFVTTGHRCHNILY